MRRLKKGCVVVVAFALSMALMTGCGDKNGKDDKIAATSTDAVTTEGTADSGSGTSATSFSSIEDMVDQYAADVQLGDYKGMTYEDKTEAVTDAEVQSKVDEFVDGLATFDKDTTSVAKKGDTVNIDFVGSVDGEEFEGGNSNGTGYDLVLGSGSFIDGFEDQIIGHKAGDKFTVTATFPENYGKEELNGKEAQFETTLNYIKIDKPATYNDELVAANTDYKTTAEYEASVRKELEQDKADSALASAQNEIMVKVINNAVINNLSVDDIQASTDNLISSIKSQAETYGMDYATYIYYYYGYDDSDKFEEYVKSICEEAQKEKMVMCAIAKKENITITDEETDAYLNDYAAKNSIDVDSLKSTLTDVECKYNALAKKVMDFLVENAKATEATTAAATESATEADSESADDQEETTAEETEADTEAETTAE